MMLAYKSQSLVWSVSD